MPGVSAPARLRVLMTADAVGGVYPYALELARALTDAGGEVWLVTMGRKLTPGQRDDAELVPGLFVLESEYRLEWMDDPWDDVERAGEWLLGLEEGMRPDVVHLNGLVHGALPWRAPVVTVGHSCLLSWWRAVRGDEPLPPEWARYRDRARAGLRSADAVVAPSRAMLAALEEAYGPTARGRVVPNGRSPSFAAPGVKQPFAFSAGRLWDEAKNLAALDRAAARLSWRVLVAGEGGGETPGDRGGRTGATRLGPLSPQALAGWLGRAAVYALPAKYEPFGLSVLEAALAGCALVLGDIESLRENWDGLASFVHPDDDGALAAAIDALCAAPALAAEAGRRARARALELSASRMAQGYLELYGSLRPPVRWRRPCAS
jgi:glycosyltransferase involved in cell wall biosynthesis